ncbi:hypothetical protein HOY80DRAFT_999664 [Tuber brumale]|nr:hypothetical protein HOY80DRAFT_999664 [Tuber brumale]
MHGWQAIRRSRGVESSNEDGQNGPNEDKHDLQDDNPSCCISYRKWVLEWKRHKGISHIQIIEQPDVVDELFAEDYCPGGISPTQLKCASAIPHSRGQTGRLKSIEGLFLGELKPLHGGLLKYYLLSKFRIIYQIGNYVPHSNTWLTAGTFVEYYFGHHLDICADMTLVSQRAVNKSRTFCDAVEIGGRVSRTDNQRTAPRQSAAQPKRNPVAKLWMIFTWFANSDGHDHSRS